MRELGSNGKRPVYWVPPPTARDPKFNGIYALQNKAVEQAAARCRARATSTSTTRSTTAATATS